MKHSRILFALTSCAALIGTSSTRFAVQAKTSDAKPLQIPAAKPDSSSPEKTVRSFVAALNENRFEDAALCIDGGASLASMKVFRRLNSPSKLKTSLSDLKITVKGERAFVSVTAGYGNEKQRGSLGLIKRAARWLLVPIVPYNSYKHRYQIEYYFASVILMPISILHSPDFYTSQVIVGLQTQCESNISDFAFIVRNEKCATANAKQERSAVRLSPPLALEAGKKWL